MIIQQWREFFILDSFYFLLDKFNRVKNYCKIENREKFNNSKTCKSPFIFKILLIFSKNNYDIISVI